jgi:hypothetical protein
MMHMQNNKPGNWLHTDSEPLAFEQLKGGWLDATVKLKVVGWIDACPFYMSRTIDC